MSKFKLGQVVVTRGVNNEIADNEKFAKEIHTALSKYINCNWGDTHPEDAKMNDEAVEHNNDRIVAKYLTSVSPIFIITEWDRSATTVLFTEEY